MNGPLAILSTLFFIFIFETHFFFNFWKTSDEKYISWRTSQKFKPIFPLVLFSSDFFRFFSDNDSSKLFLRTTFPFGTCLKVKPNPNKIFLRSTARFLWTISANWNNHYWLFFATQSFTNFIQGEVWSIRPPAWPLISFWPQWFIQPLLH